MPVDSTDIRFINLSLFHKYLPYQVHILQNQPTHHIIYLNVK